MTAGIAVATLNSWLDGLGNATNWTAPTAFWVKLHTGDPGASGTCNPAGNTTRQQASFAAASAAGIATDADLDWTSVSTSETYSYVSFWTASVAGTFLGSGALAVPQPVLSGGDFKILAGALTMAISPVAA